MKEQIMQVPPKAYQRGNYFNRFTAILLLGTVLSTFCLKAQDSPPVPPTLPPTEPPREPTPEELEAQRKAQEAHWQQTLERFSPWLVESNAKAEAAAADAD